MKVLHSQHVSLLADAIYDAFPNAGRLDELLRADRLEKRFDDLTSRAKPLRENCWDVASRAYDQGWALELVIAARDSQPDNPRLRELWALLPDGDHLPLGARQRLDRPSLVCGRAPQWQTVCECAPAPRHQILIVAGELGQDALHFRDRIQVWLMPDPRRSIVAVHWPTRPVSRDAFLEALARALGTDPPRVAAAILDRLTVQNLVLLHDCLTVNFEDPNLLAYYAEWLPSVIGSGPTRYNLKCVQPIEWPSEARAWRLLRRLGFDDDRRGRDGVLQFIKSLRERNSPALPVVDLDELAHLTEDEIRRFLRNSGLTDEQQRRMMEHVRGGPQQPASIFRTIDGYWYQVQAAP